MERISFVDLSGVSCALVLIQYRVKSLIMNSVMAPQAFQMCRKLFVNINFNYWNHTLMAFEQINLDLSCLTFYSGVDARGNHKL